MSATEKNQSKGIGGCLWSIVISDKMVREGLFGTMAFQQGPERIK